ncbi:N-acetyltransferase [Massilia sp. YIM B04103]|uniref:N-acyl amino acid synthase FeeM domain-containing protein n=1 Tax=Massilia sp. YIM B04103 TaxID=2963106 RepID=UPI00210BD604|nr:N-acetyltransferase [Massilia sp. YIM B04103]
MTRPPNADTASAADHASGAILSPDAEAPPQEGLQRDAFEQAASQQEKPDLVGDEQFFGIRLVDTPDGRNKASMLISKMYAWRGLEGDHGLTEDPNRVTLMAHRKGEPVGTLTLGLDSTRGLLADQLFQEEIDAYRARGARVCEFIKLAFDMGGQSRPFLAALIHLAMMYARDIHQCDQLFIEVTPRHSGFYSQMMGFTQLGDAKVNPRVNVRGVLMRLDLAYMKEQVELYGGQGDQAEGVRSFYPLFFSPREEAGIINRLKTM